MSCTGIGDDCIGAGCSYWNAGSRRVFWIPPHDRSWPPQCTATEASELEAT